MPQPLFRYASEEQNVIDGAVFAIVEATDPEIFLMIEAYKDDEGKTGWRYAAKRSHYLSMKVYKGKEVVWTSELNRDLGGTQEGEMPYAAEPYFTFFAQNYLIPPPGELSQLLQKGSD